MVLRRCRMEGSMIRGVEVGSSAVQYCPLDQLTGAGDSTWTLSSADMLSFARQIALAMVRKHFVCLNIVVQMCAYMEICLLRKSNNRSLDFVVSYFFMKVFNT